MLLMIPKFTPVKPMAPAHTHYFVDKLNVFIEFLDVLKKNDNLCVYPYRPSPHKP